VRAANHPDWQSRPLGELTDKIGSGATPKGGQSAYKESGISLIRSLNVHDLEFRYKDLARIDGEQAEALSNVEVEARDVLLNITGASIARCSQVPSDVLPARVNQHVSILRPKNGLLDSRFLSYLLVSDGTKNQLLNIGDKAGATRQALTKAQLQAFEIPVPPLEEQKRIVAALDQAFAALDRARAHAEANLADAAILFETSLDDVMTTHSTAGEKTKLESVCTFENGDRGVNYPGRKAFVPEGIPFINAGHLDRGSIDWEGMNFIPEAHFHRISKGKVKKGDLLFCLRGSLGKFGHVDREGLGAIASSLVIVRAGNALLTDYLQMYFKSKGCRQMIDRYAGGAAQPNLSAGDLKKFEIVVPSLDRQTIAVEKHDRLLDATLKLGDAYTMQLEHLANLRQSLLQKAFSGELI
jgi:type I restriction enzyme S subunit